MTVSKLLETAAFYGAKVLAGADSLDRTVNWCAPDVTVDDSSKSWVLPGLLSIYIGRSQDENWSGYVERVRRERVSGVVIVSRNYGELAISAAELAVFNDASIPLIWLQTGMSVTTFISRIMQTLIYYENKEYSYEEWLRGICNNRNKPINEASAEANGYCPERVYYCLTLNLKHVEKMSPLETERHIKKAMELLNVRLSTKEASILSFSEESTEICFIPFHKSKSGLAIREELNSVIKEMRDAEPGDKWMVIAGTPAKSVDQFFESYHNAELTTQIVKSLDVHENISFYKDWYMHMLLLRGTRSELEVFMVEALEPILESPELLESLTAYLVFGENTKMTADALHIHVNTLKYRISRICELLNCDLKDTVTRFRLRMAITIYRYFRNDKQEISFDIQMAEEKNRLYG